MPQLYAGPVPADPSLLLSPPMADGETGILYLPAHLLSSEERLRMLFQVSRINNQTNLPKSFVRGDAVRSNVYTTHSPCERRQQERVRARAKLLSMKERKAQFAKCVSPQTRSGKPIRRISCLTESLLSVPSPVLKEDDEDSSTICMHASTFGGEPDLLDYENLDDIFDEDECDGSFENSRKHSLACGHVVPTKQTPAETVPVRMPVSQVSFGYGSERVSHHQISPLAPKPRHLTPKECGLSSWDDVSSIATLSRLGGFEPEPLPMGHSPIPLVIFVPTSAAVNEDWLEPLNVFPPGYSSPKSFAGHAL
eukprot:scaffold36418_cov191-Amphora_coffeaeformis.AAC.3